MENMQNSTIPAPKPVRPTFLTVLCILTFIGSAWGIIGGISNYMNASVASEIAGEAIDAAKEEIKAESDEPGSKVAEKMLSGVSSILDPAKLRKNALFSIGASVLTLLGGLLMFQLKKTGFWVYLLGTFVGIIAPIVVYGANNLLSLGMSTFIGFFGILFVIMYAVNLKHMR
ncbi:MAG: hypothetical protein SFU87_09255 [Chitinophagaceae bacterium]|nr:hypothetical protein [Chitinophagaceae bacterium]